MKLTMYIMSVALVAILTSPAKPQTELTFLNQFPTSGGIGLAFDRMTDTVWTYGSDTLRSYDRTGKLLSTINNAPGETANDADLDFADVPLTLGITPIPAGTLLFTNGETDSAEVYAISSTGTLLATLNTTFGNSHVVGSAFSPQRGTFFLVQDRVPADPAIDNLVAEIHAESGAVLNLFDLDSATSGFTVNFGDLEVRSVTGSLLIVSTDETQILELSPTGTELSRWILALGAGGTLSASGIALDDVRNELFVQTTDGTVYHFAIPGASRCDFNRDGAVDAADAGIMFNDWGPSSGSPADKNKDGFVDAADAGTMFAEWTGDLGPTNVPESSTSLHFASMLLSTIVVRRFLIRPQPRAVINPQTVAATGGCKNLNRARKSSWDWIVA